MHIFNNDLSISGKPVDKKFSWTSGLLKKSEKEPTTVLENLTQDLRTEKDAEDTNQKALEEVRSSDTVRELFEKQNEGNVVNKHHYGDKGTNETQLNNAEGQRNDEYYSSGLSLFTREVFPKMRERMKKNEEFYKMPENKDRVGEGDVVSAGAKEIKVVKAQAVLAEPTMIPSETLTDTYIQEDIQQRLPEIQQQPEIQNQQMRQENSSQHKEQTHKEELKKKTEDTGPKKHSLKYWNYVTKEWKTIAENDDAKELESMKEDAIKKYYEGSQFSGQNAPFEIFVNEHVKKR